MALLVRARFTSTTSRGIDDCNTLVTPPAKGLGKRLFRAVYVVGVRSSAARLAPIQTVESRSRGRIKLKFQHGKVFPHPLNMIRLRDNYVAAF